MSSPRARHFRTRTVVVSFSTLIVTFNTLIALRLLSYWRILRWEPDSEWEMTVNDWNVDGSIKFLWFLLLFYFVGGAAMNAVGAIGAFKRSSSLLRQYRNYVVTDFCASAFTTIAVIFVTFGTGGTVARTTLCEELTFQPDLLRQLNLNEIGLIDENCEEMLRHASFLAVGTAAMILFIRLQFIFTVIHCYKQIFTEQRKYVQDAGSHIMLIDVDTPEDYRYKRI